MGRGIAALSVLASFAIPVQMSASAAGQDAGVAETGSGPQVRALHRVLAARLSAGPAIFFKDGKPLASG